MLKTLISDTINPTLISFKPRQVLLAKPSMKHNNDKASNPALKLDQKTLLLRSIAGYLKSNGFSKTLKMFLSEAKIQKDNVNDSSLDLEDMYCKYLESCDHGSTNFNIQKVQDSLMNGNSKRVKEADLVGGVETVGKKKKKRSDGGNDAIVIRPAEPGKVNDSKETEQVVLNDAVPELNKKPKEKRKSKKIFDSLDQAEQISTDMVKKHADNVVCDSQLHESKKKHKEKKKKKSKLDSESLVDNVEPLVVGDKQGTKAKEAESLRGSQAFETTKVNANNISVGEEIVKSKSKKKKTDGSISKNACDGDSKEIDERKSSKTETKKDDNKTSEEVVTVKESKSSKKRKRLDTEENNSQPIDKKEVEETKRRKTEGSGGPRESYQVTEMNASQGTDGDAGKQSNDQVGFKNSVGKPDGQVNAILEEENKSSLRKTMKKEMNGSAEPKTVQAFQRVKVDEVEFTDERLKDNSYWAKGGADSGYGAKAQEVLGQVRGRDFRHEKTKKKRGSYKGGQIDLQSHSIKFSYSDED